MSHLKGLGIQAVSFRYPGQRPLLRDLSVVAGRGRVTAILGPNGSGKTTLLRILLGQLRPDAGHVFLDEWAVTDIGERERACLMAYVPQEGSSAFAMRLSEVVDLGCWPAGGQHELAVNEMAHWHLEDLAEANWPSLSGGERQRGLLARACCQIKTRGQALLLDEPTASMDPAWAHRTLQLLKQRAVEDRLAVVAVIHDLDLAARYADDVWLLSCGELLAAGPAGEVLTAEHLEQAYGVGFRMVDLENGYQTPVVANPPA